MSKGINLSAYTKNICNPNNFSTSTKLNKIAFYENWHIKNFNDFFKLIEDIRNIPRLSKYRSIEELVELISIIQEENIDLFYFNRK